jgi:heme-degrading monooxygenase HmoA
MVDEFVSRWQTWLEWTAENIPGFRSAKLLRSEDDPQRFTSISDWDDDATLKAWKESPGFAERIGPVREVCDEFVGGDFDVAVSVKAPGS